MTQEIIVIIIVMVFPQNFLKYGIKIKLMIYMIQKIHKMALKNLQKTQKHLSCFFSFLFFCFIFFSFFVVLLLIPNLFIFVGTPLAAGNVNVLGISTLCLRDGNDTQVLELLQVYLWKDLILIYQILVQQYNVQVVNQSQLILVETYIVCIAVYTTTTKNCMIVVCLYTYFLILFGVSSNVVIVVFCVLHVLVLW